MMISRKRLYVVFQYRERIMELYELSGTAEEIRMKVESLLAED